MTRDQLIKSINELADSAVADMNKGIPTIQRRILNEIQDLARGLDYKNGRISVTVKNIRTIGQISNKLKRIVLTEGYEKKVKRFIKAFNEITTLQNKYLRQTFTDFSLTPVLKEIKMQAVESTLTSLTEQGLEANVLLPIREVLQKNITTGGNFNQLLDEARQLILTVPDNEGRLERYVKQITTDAINQYSRNYLQTAAGTSAQWYQYTGSLIKTSRCFCIAMVEKRFFHVSEIPKLLRGDFPEFEQHECRIYDKTGLPQGMIAGTNVANFLINLGGYSCGHRAIPVHSSLVPQAIKDRIK